MNFLERNRDLIESGVWRHAAGICGMEEHLCPFCNEPVNVLDALPLEAAYSLVWYSGCEFRHYHCNWCINFRSKAGLPEGCSCPQ